MSLSSIAANIVNTITGGVIDRALDMVDKLIPDRTKANELKMQLETLRVQQAHEDEMAAVQLLLGQIETNKVEAANTSVFVSGWRPFIGWVCGVGIGYAFIVHPMALFIAFLFGADLSRMPPLDVGTLLSLVLSMLGIATLRSYDKKQGTDTVSVGG